MNKKGFTLIEILTVIVVLGLLGAIIIPKVVNTIDSSKKNSDRVSAELLVRALTNIAIDKKANLVSFDGCSIDFDNDSNTCTDLEYSGKLPTSGSISVDSDGVVNGSVGFGENIYQIAYNAICYDGCVGFEYTFDYSGSQQEFKISNSGFYRLEVWGAQGGSTESVQGGYGGYSIGTIKLSKNTKLYINVGGKGSDSIADVITINSGGYNGGGDGYVHRSTSGTSASGGGGATHIALESGVLSSLSSDIDKILIVAGGGGGSHDDTDAYGYSTIGGSGGGYIGGSIVQTGICTNNCTSYSYPSGGTQSNGGLGVISWSSGATSSSQYVGYFGVGATGTNSYGGGGGGFYGGASGQYSGGGGGSGYIGNSSLLDKHMTCFECQESADVNIKTVSTMNISEEPISDMAKIGNGFAKITYLGKSID